MTSAIYAVNTTAAPILSGATATLTTVIRRLGCGINLNNGGVSVTSNGYFSVDANVTVLPTATGAISASVYVNGSQYPGAIATGTAATASDAVNLTIPTIIRNCNGMSTITIVVSGAGTVNNAAMVVEKI